MITSRLPKEKNVQIGFTKRPFLYLLAGLFSMTCTYAAEDIEKIESCKFRLFVTKIFAWPIEDQKSWLQDHPKQITAEDENRQTLLHYAVITSRHSSLSQALLSLNPKIEVKDKNGKTPLMEAVDELRHVNVDLLLKKGADPNAQDNNKWNALHCLYRSQSYNFTRYDFSKTEKLLLSYGTFRFVSRII